MRLNFRKLARRLLHRPMHRPEAGISFVRLGSDYGGWPVLPNETGPETVVFSFGIGEDITFETELSRRFGSRVYGFDPTPKSIRWVSAQELPEGFAFFPVGLAAADGQTTFHAPSKEGYVSYSMTPRVGAAQGKTVSAPVLRLETILSSFTLPPPDVVKMDIEGFEYEVIDDLLKGEIRPRQLLVEFHHEMYRQMRRDDTRLAVRKLRNAGYRIFFVSDSGREYGFYRSA